MRHWKLAVIAVGAVAAITALGACTSGGGAGDSVAGQSAVGPRPAASVAAGGVAGGVARSQDAPLAGDTDLALGTSEIRTVELSVTVRHGTPVATQADAAESIVVGVGGEVDADQRDSGRYASADLVLKVPPDQLAPVLDKLSKLGIETSRHRTTTDVTARVADVTSRVTSAREAIARLRGLYAHTTKVTDVIAVESELASRESDLEALEAQQRALSVRTATATVTLKLSTQVVAPHPVKPAPAHHDSGFLAGLGDGWHAFATGAAAVATAAGAVLPFAALAVVLLLAVRLLWPRLRPAARPAATTPE